MSIFNYEIEIFEKGTWVQLSPWIRPFHDSSTLDESLDSGQIVLAKTPRRESFAPFTPLRIGIYEVPDMSLDVMGLSEAKKAPYRMDYIYRLIADTQVEQRGFAYNGGEDWYRHTINTIEYSKLLEREVCDNITFSRYLGHDYASGAEPISPEMKYSGKTDVLYDALSPTFYISPYKLGAKLQIANIHMYMTDVVEFAFVTTIKLLYPSGKEEIITRSDSATGTIVGIVVLDQEGDYEITYEAVNRHSLSTDPGIRTFVYKISSVKCISQKTEFSITDTLNRILTICPTRRNGVETQRYILDSAAAAKLSEIEAPEFHITRSTLWEALSQVGGFIHAIPRLKYPNVITFDELGGSEEYIPPTGLKCICYSAGRQIDETCDAIDSTVENFLCTQDLGQGSITEPCNNGWKTLRCDDNGFIISNDTALIVTDHPIYRLIKVEVGALTLAPNQNAAWGTLGDLTPYIYESAEYKTLSSYGGTYPNSRSFALQYVQGDNKITDLSYKQETKNILQELGIKPAFENIMQRIGVPISGDYGLLAFRVVYIPMTSARVKQYKPYAADGKAASNTLLYNQSANTVESASYGENLKGTIARLGNRDEQCTYHFEHYSDLPKVGQLWDGKYIAHIDQEFEKQWIKATVTLTENFNRLAQYLGLHTNYRLYDVSEKQSVERQINYGERIIIGENTDALDKTCTVINESGIALFAKTVEGHNGANPIGNVVLNLTDTNDKQIRDTLMLPCTSTALGNSIALSWKFADNYGAGYKSSPSEAFKRIQEIVPYGDVYGEFYYMHASLYNGMPGGSMPFAAPYDLPQYSGEQFDGLLNFGSAPLIVDKDSREQLNVTYQLHFVANRRSIVIGSGLGQYNALVSPDPLETELFFSDKRLNVFRPIFPLSEAGRKDFTVTRNFKTLLLELPAAPTGSKSWALVGVRRDKDGNIKSKQLIIGENIDGAVKPVYFNFVSNKEV